MIGDYIKVILAFAIVGPAIGGLITWLVLLGVEISAQMVGVLVATVLWSYVFGGVQALITGIVSAIYLRVYKSLPIIIPVLASLVFPIWQFIVQSPAPKTRWGVIIAATAYTIAVHVVPAIGCCILARYLTNYSRRGWGT